MNIKTALFSQLPMTMALRGIIGSLIREEVKTENETYAKAI